MPNSPRSQRSPPTASSKTVSSKTATKASATTGKGRDLYNLYDQKLRGILLQQERLRRFSLRVFYVLALLIGLTALWLALFWLRLLASSQTTYDQIRLWLISGALLVASIYGAYELSSWWFRHSFKYQVVQVLVNWLEASLHFTPQGYVPQSHFVASQLFPGEIQRYRGEDLLSGELDGLRIACSEVKVSKKVGFSSKKKGSSLFQGVFFAISLAQSLPARVILYPRIATEQPLFSRRWQRVKLEDPQFERHFNVYANDQVGARVLLTTSFMEQVMAMQARCDSTPYLSFVDQQLYIAMPSRKNRFEASLFSSTLNPKALRQAIEEIDSVLDIIRALQLETLHKY